MTQVITPLCYDSFHCLASRCPDTCCQLWDIDIDPDTLSLYKSLPGQLGEQIRSSLRQGEDGPIIALQEGSCPMHRPDGLCAIQAELGEDALCDVCREFPRLRHDYGDFVELGLELSCPEAARILLTEDLLQARVQSVPGNGDPDYDRDAMAVLKQTREAALRLTADESRPLGQTLTLLFFWGLHAQQLLDGEETQDFSPENALETAVSLRNRGDFSEIPAFFSTLDILTDRWRELLGASVSPALPTPCRNLALYLIGRYWLQAVSDYDLYCRVKFIVIACLLVGSLPGDLIDNAHLFSKEVENDCDNLEAILDAAYSDPVFTDDRLLGYLFTADLRDNS